MSSVTCLTLFDGVSFVEDVPGHIQFHSRVLGGQGNDVSTARRFFWASDTKSLASFSLFSPSSYTMDFDGFLTAQLGSSDAPEAPAVAEGVVDALDEEWARKVH